MHHHQHHHHHQQQQHHNIHHHYTIHDRRRTLLSEFIPKTEIPPSFHYSTCATYGAPARPSQQQLSSCYLILEVAFSEHSITSIYTVRSQSSKVEINFLCITKLKARKMRIINLSYVLSKRNVAYKA